MTPATLQPIYLAGPTAVGKSAVALELAERLQGEIISVDSMQVYRGLDIGTAKPSPSEQARIPYHLIDVADLNENFDAARFSRMAADIANKIQARGHLPIFCGGTGLYFKALLEGLGQAPPANRALRRTLEQNPIEELLEELAQRDPETYERIDRANPRRIIRAVEVIRLTDRPFSEQRAGWSRADNGPPRPNAFALERDREDLHDRINRRVETMFAAGLVQETRALMTQGLGTNETASQALGYRQVIEHLRGERTLPETIELVKVRTRQFAKRQMTWFRRQLNFEWVNISRVEDPTVIVLDRLASVLPD